MDLRKRNGVALVQKRAKDSWETFAPWVKKTFCTLPWPVFRDPLLDAAFLLTVGSFLLTMELFYLQLTIFAFYLQLELFCLNNFSYFAYSWRFLAYSWKV